ncbi:MAG TPA: glycoside hydrolase [Bosea sp. (in: a-proteobacteria)]|jgi:hypothetical protein|uniref:glycoside hydrolase n=1 Tax=Bosea sp. (in: a-proteobacteria) TaxID=1871050 RepID=UPI002DDD5735|nr:glycoside hydrolase [Bosea sp. (in: a-proteobacteria)]HEV2552708.1 glycoside hydrolase [Bosea sp. (in: a-proteobacteria)]
MDAAAFACSLIGRPYERDGLHCWELVRQCQAVVFGRALPAVLAAPESRRELVGLMARRHEAKGWREIAGPAHGAVVFLTRKGHVAAKAACHAGVWLDLDGGGFLHTDDPHGVVFDSAPDLRARNWADPGFYLPVESLPVEHP